MPVTPGQVIQSVRGSASLVVALKRLKAVHDETPELIRAALRRAASPEKPDEHHARQFATTVEGRMWEKDPGAADANALGKAGHWLKDKRRRAQRSLERETIDWPDWREELEAWVLVTVDQPELTKLREDSHEHKVPRTVAKLAKDFPQELYLELQSPPKTDYRWELLTRLTNADKLNQRIRWTNRLAGATGAGTATAAGLIGFDVIAVAEGLVPVATAAAASGSLAVTERRAGRRAARREPVRRYVRDWSIGYREVASALEVSDRTLAELRADVTQRLIARAEAAEDDDLLDGLFELENVLICRERGAAGPDEVTRVLDRLLATAAMSDITAEPRPDESTGAEPVAAPGAAEAEQDEPPKSVSQVGSAPMSAPGARARR